MLVETDRLDEAVAVVREAVDTVGGRPEIHTLAGKVYLKTGNLMEALHAFEKSIFLRRDGNTDAFIGLCCIYRLAGRKDTMVETLRAVEPLLGGDRRYHLARWILTGDYDPAVLPDAANDGYADERTALRRLFFDML